MKLLQIQIDDELSNAIRLKAEKYGVPSSSLIRITLVKAFLDDEPWVEGNIFNAERDSAGSGIAIDNLIKML